MTYDQVEFSDYVHEEIQALTIRVLESWMSNPFSRDLLLMHAGEKRDLGCNESAVTEYPCPLPLFFAPPNTFYRWLAIVVCSLSYGGTYVMIIGKGSMISL